MEDFFKTQNKAIDFYQSMMKNEKGWRKKVQTLDNVTLEALLGVCGFAGAFIEDDSQRNEAIERLLTMDSRFNEFAPFTTAENDPYV